MIGIIASAQAFNDGFPRSTPEAQGVRSEDIAQAFRTIEEKGYDVHGLMILRHGYVIAEHWWAPYAPDLQHAMYSATKTFTGCAVGFAVQEGLLKTSDKMISFFPNLLPEKLPAGLEELSVEHLLTMSAGHATTSYPGSGDAQVRSFLATEFKHKPGTSFAYDVACSHMLSNIITRVTGISLYEYLKPRLLDPLGITDVVWEMDVDGRNMGNGGMHLRTSDLAKLGQFLLQQGEWNGRQLLSKEWMAAMTTPHIFQNPDRSEEEKAKDDSSQGYGYQTWMGRHDSYRAIGGCNQLAMVLPEQDLVIASTGFVRDEAGFNEIFYNLADTMSGKKLKADKNFDLNAAISGYEFKRPYEDSGLGAVVKSKTLRYNMYQNKLGIKSLGLRFDTEGNLTVTMETEGAIHNISYGLDDWKMGQTDRKMAFQQFSYPNTMSVTPVITAGYCSWTDKDTLSAYYLSMFNVGAEERFEFSFGEDGVTMTIKGRQETVLQGSRIR